MPIVPRRPLRDWRGFPVPEALVTHISAPGVRSIAEVDANLRKLAEQFARRTTSPRFGLRDIRRFRAAQDALLDRRCELMAERDAWATVAA
jgi:hypothetical protein